MRLALPLGVVLVASGLGVLLARWWMRRAGMVKPGEPMPTRVWVMSAGLTLWGCAIVTLFIAVSPLVAVAVGGGVILLLHIVGVWLSVVSDRRKAREARARRRAADS